MVETASELAASFLVCYAAFVKIIVQMLAFRRKRLMTVVIR